MKHPRSILMKIIYAGYGICMTSALSLVRAGEILGFSLIPQLQHRIYRKSQSSSRSSSPLWFHAASMGEVRGVFPLIREIIKEVSAPVLISVTSETGFKEAKNLLPEATVVYAPIDTPAQVRRFLDQYTPRFLCIAETELWPALFFESANRELPICIVNARISDKTFSRYLFFRPAMEALFESCRIIFAQSKKDIERFSLLGVPPEKLMLMYSTKYDFPIEKSSQFLDWWRFVGGEELSKKKHVFSFGSVRDTDEHEILIALQYLKKSTSWDNIFCIIVPRHPKRFDPFYESLCAQGFRVARLSAAPESLYDNEILYVDRMGDLLGVYSISKLCFVGGTFGEVGGHNVLEPAYYGKPILSGDSLHNIEEVAEILREKGALTTVRSGEELGRKGIMIIEDLHIFSCMSDASRTVYNSLQGASTNISKIIKATFLLLCLSVQACSPVRGYAGPELPDEEISLLSYETCDRNVMRIRSSVIGKEFSSNGIELLPGTYAIDAYVESPEPPYNCVVEYQFDQYGFEQCLRQQQEAIQKNKKHVPICSHLDYQRKIQRCLQNFRQFMCTLSVTLEKGQRYDLCAYTNSGFVRARVYPVDTKSILNEVECAFTSADVRNVEL